MIRKYSAVALGLSLAVWAAALAAYPYLPDKIPIHWNIRGEVDNYGQKTWAVFLMPVAIVALWGLFRLLPWLSPKSFTLDTFRGTYEFIAALTLGLLAYIHALMLWAAWAGPVDVSRPLLAGMCLFFTLLGSLLGKVKRNFFVGVRTPWTLASERVWIDTHRLAARLFVTAGLIGFSFSVAVGGRIAFTATLGLIVCAALVPVAYSLIHYKRLERQGLM